MPSKKQYKLYVSHSPHIAGGDTTQTIMLHVIIALLPALLAGCIVFGSRALLVVLLCVNSCVIFEALWQKLMKKPITISDFSAVITGMILGMNLPVNVPIWIPIIGSFFAIIIVKQFFGGLGHNFMNPALAARAFMLASWTLPMTTFPQVDAVTSATPLVALSDGMANLPSYLTLFLGNVSGCIGETSKLALLIGGIYLLVTKVIRLRVPLIFIGTVALGTWIFGGSYGPFTGDPLYHVLSGGLIFGAFFMATDYTTTPFTPNGQILFGFGCGVITVLIRLWGGYPEGASYSILLMNVATPLIDKVCKPRRYGTTRFKKEVA